MHITEALPNLSPASARYTRDTLLGALPPPVPDTPDARTTRDGAAIAAVAALHPANAFEGQLAATIVAMHAHAMDCVRLAGQRGQPPDDVRRWLSLAATMMREVQSGRRVLLDLQARRKKADAALNRARTEPAGHRSRDLPAARRPGLRVVH